MSSPTTLHNLLLLGLGLQEGLTYMHAGKLLEGGDLGVGKKPGLAAAVALTLENWANQLGEFSMDPVADGVISQDTAAAESQPAWPKL